MTGPDDHLRPSDGIMTGKLQTQIGLEPPSRADAADWEAAEMTGRAKVRSSGPARCPIGDDPGRTPQRQTGQSRRRLMASRVLIPLVILCACAILFVGMDVIEAALFPTMSTGMRHALLTLRAGIVTAVGTFAGFWIARRREKGLTQTADQLARLLESYQAQSSSANRFENPHLIHCREFLNCERTDCPMYDSPGERCWQVVALSRAARDDGAPSVDIQRCHACEVYRRSCPDKLTELGEAFNDLMFLLEEEGEQVDRMRAQMVEKEKMVATGQMAAGIAHEVCNPLSSISSIVQMLKRERPPPPMTERLDLIETHIQRINGTVRELVSLARPSAERWELVDLGVILEDVKRLIAFDRRARDVEIMFEPPRSLPRTYGLRGELQQVFINLTLNALDAMPNGGKLTIRAQKRRNNIAVRVEDTGCGIHPETGRRIFEPFFTTKQAGQGSGLGLAVSYGIIQKHGGRLDFTSTVGDGTAFTVQIPILKKPIDA